MIIYSKLQLQKFHRSVGLRGLKPKWRRHRNQRPFLRRLLLKYLWAPRAIWWHWVKAKNVKKGVKELPNFLQTNLFIHLITFQSRESSNKLLTYSFKPEPFFVSLILSDKCPSKFANLWGTKKKLVSSSQYGNSNNSLKRIYLRCLGRTNLFLMSALRSPNKGVSTVSTRALNPAFSARFIRLSVTSRSM